MTEVKISRKRQRSQSPSEAGEQEPKRARFAPIPETPSRSLSPPELQLSSKSVQSYSQQSKLWPRFELKSKYKVLRVLVPPDALLEAQDLSTGRRVAIKSQPLSNDTLVNLIAETRILRTLSDKCDPYVLCFYEAFVSPSNQTLFIVTELLTDDWTDMREWIHDVAEGRRDLPTASERLTIGCNLVAGLGFLHDLDVVHRDIKPENLLLNTQTLQVKYIDFGLSCLGAQCRYSARGTEVYSPPEVLHRDARLVYSLPLFKQGDLYSLGLVLYELSQVHGQLYQERFAVVRGQGGAAKAQSQGHWDSKTGQMYPLEAEAAIGVPVLYRAFLSMTNRDPFKRAIPAELLRACASSTSSLLSEAELFGVLGEAPGSSSGETSGSGSGSDSSSSSPVSSLSSMSAVVAGQEERRDNVQWSALDSLSLVSTPTPS